MKKDLGLLMEKFIPFLMILTLDLLMESIGSVSGELKDLERLGCAYRKKKV